MKNSIVILILLSMPSVALAQTSDPTVAQSGASDAASEFDELKKKAEAEKAVYEAVKAAADARKAAAEAEIKATEAKLGVVKGQTAIAGETTLKDGAAKAEALLLVTKATRDAASTLGPRIASAITDETRPIFLATGTDGIDARDSIAFSLKSGSILAMFKATDEQFKVAQAADANLKKDDSGSNRAGALAVVGGTVEALSKLGSYFQSNYEIGEVVTTTPSYLLLNSVAESIRVSKPGVKLIYPDRLPAFDATQLSADLQKLHDEYAKVVGLRGKSESRAAQLNAKKDPNAKRVASLYNGTKASSDKAIGAYEALMTELFTVPDNAEMPATRIIRQQELAKLMTAEKKPLVLLLSAENAAAFYTKKNLWTFLGGAPLHTMGGVSISYSLYDPTTGEVKSSGSVAKHGGYRSVRQVEKLFK